jgi:hypothetical protein
MPTADSFFALGMGNGFPFCPPKVDVSSDDLWSTIDGYNKSSTGTRTAAGIIESKRLAMLYVWNTYQINGSVAVGSDSLSNVNSEDDTSSGNPLPPKLRVCLDGSDGFGDQIETEDADGFPVASLALDVPLSVTAMYNGSTSNESNFIGYGIADSASDGIYAESEDLAGFGDYAWVQFKCVGFASESDCFTSGGNEYCTVKRDSQYTSLSMGGETFYGVGVAEISNLDAGGSPTVNGSTMSATSEFVSFPNNLSVSTSLTSLTAYSY